MSVSCKYCGAVAGHGHELGHRNNCPTLKKDFEINYSPKDVLFIRMNKEQEYEKLASEVTDELNSIDNMLQDTVKRCIELSTSEVTASITFKVPAFVIPDNIQELKSKLLRLKQLSKYLELDYLQNDEIDMAIEALDNVEASYYKEYDNYNDIDDLRWGLDMDI